MSLASVTDQSIAVLLGGSSSEREISLQSGATVCEALTNLGALALPVDTADSHWWDQLSEVDAAFIILHGGDGEDGTVQGALQTLGIPYTGSGVLASALAMDKLRSKRLWRGIGLPTAGFAELTGTSDLHTVLDELGPVFVKPAEGGSSIGTGAAHSVDELVRVRAEAFKYGDRVIAEQLIDGDEYTVAILDGAALPAIRMETDSEFYDYEAKYFSDETRYLCPCGLAAKEAAELARTALLAFDSLGCASWGRVDFMRDRQGSFWILEVNTVPGMTSHSLVPMAAKAAGIELPELVARITDSAFRRGDLR